MYCFNLLYMSWHWGRKCTFNWKILCCCTHFCSHFTAVVEISYEKVITEVNQIAARAFCTKYTDKFTSPKRKLLTFLVKANTAQGKGQLGSWHHNFIDICNIPAAVVQHGCWFFWRILLKTILPIILPTFL